MTAKATTAAIIIAILLGGISHASDITTVVAYRGADGRYSHASNENFKAMRHAAKAYGRIEVWVAFDMDYQGDPLLRDDEDVQSEAQVKQWHISQTIQPIVDLGQATMLPVPQGFEQAPGCLISVSESGLKKLKKISEVKHLSYKATIE